MSLTSFLESIKTNETDLLEGGLFLCESDLISSFLTSQYAGSLLTVPAHASDVPSALQLQKGKPNIGAC